MSEKEAEQLYRRYLEHKMIWHREDGFPDLYAVPSAVHVLGLDKVDEIGKEIHKLWNED
jgi:hypothetical protein